jgi:hypothetical protein
MADRNHSSPKPDAKAAPQPPKSSRSDVNPDGLAAGGSPTNIEPDAQSTSSRPHGTTEDPDTTL